MTPTRHTADCPAPLARYALAIAACAVILTVLLALLSHLLGHAPT